MTASPPPDAPPVAGTFLRLPAGLKPTRTSEAGPGRRYWQCRGQRQCGRWPGVGRRRRDAAAAAVTTRVMATATGAAATALTRAVTGPCALACSETHRPAGWLRVAKLALRVGQPERHRLRSSRCAAMLPDPCLLRPPVMDVSESRNRRPREPFSASSGLSQLQQSRPEPPLHRTRLCS